MERTAKLLVACTGSVATIKLQELLGLLSATDLFDIQIILTKSVRFLRLRRDISWDQICKQYKNNTGFI